MAVQWQSHRLVSLRGIEALIIGCNNAIAMIYFLDVVIIGVRSDAKTQKRRNDFYYPWEVARFGQYADMSLAWWKCESS